MIRGGRLFHTAKMPRNFQSIFGSQLECQTSRISINSINSNLNRLNRLSTTMTIQINTQLTQHEQIQAKILALQEALLEKNPKMPYLLREIHTNLKNDPAVVTLLTEDEIAIIVSGLQAQTMVQIVTTQVKPSAQAKKALTKVTTDDLGFD